MTSGSVVVNSEECKGCGLCVEACPPKVLKLSAGLNPYGYHPAEPLAGRQCASGAAACFMDGATRSICVTGEYTGDGCTGCGICFFACPEPGGITVLRLAA